MRTAPWLAACVLLLLAGACGAACPAGQYAARTGTQHQSCGSESDCPSAQPHCCGALCVCDDGCGVRNSTVCTDSGLCDDPSDVGNGTCAGGGVESCGPSYSNAVCGGGAGYLPNPSFAIYCNEDTGQCGNTDAHRDAQPSTAYDFVSNCDACPAGKFKETNGSAPCTQCPAGKHSGSTGRTSISACVD
jgi:hypothetical protein